jgi:multicomponent Na+:H+ antiporter subunit C
MNLIYAAAISAIMALGLYLMLSRHVMRIAYGVMLVSATVNLCIFLAGRIGDKPPPIMSAGETALGTGAANPLPQALVLTAIVIGFSLVAFLVALALKTYRRSGTLDHRQLGQAEALGSPFADISPRPAATGKEARS